MLEFLCVPPKGPKSFIFFFSDVCLRSKLIIVKLWDHRFFVTLSFLMASRNFLNTFPDLSHIAGLLSFSDI